ncbi:hypothetical protein TMatcc_008598 [Talaromyces marneffei ATCC 18224]|uniref:C6 transcription factor, putative n=1 Tax=Talaromyces marneffei (strain ATCC 18224 / CBS 334.59 / QM 7333) TaxID=441960 RepID=B6QLK2_TALMQ|nr:C6 transcription factor, putative [Talaromyces marneffei ATCC 18224]KAE8550557.1 hypothetical protein EYB25_006785 [Talaromyces marneffei]
MKSTTSSASSAPASKKLSQFIFTDPISKPLPKRQQVSRACDWCRSLRVKCDNRYPCRNCQTKGRTCNIRGANAAQTCNAAISRIAVLQDRIRDLEQQVEIAKAKIQDDDDDDDDVVGTLINDAADGGNHKTEVKSEPLPSASPHLDQVQRFGEQRRSKHLESIHIQTVHPHQRHCYGRSSSFYFIGRLSSYLGLPPCQLTSDGLMQMDPEAQSLKNSLNSDVSLTELYLSKSQEEYFLHLFFPSYNVYYPIIDLAEFMQHYQSLWTSPTSRRSSALVDIVLALSMQYADALMPRDYAALRNNIEGIVNIDAAIAGRKFYRRCQLLLTDELEGPSITTLQCHFFSVIYLSNASFHNAAHSHLAMAVRTGTILGLHWHPPGKVSDQQAEFRKRLWWTVYALEIKMTLELGRPLALTMSQIPCPPPDRHQDDPYTHQGTNRFTANRHFIQLMLGGRVVYATFQRKCSEALGHDHNNNSSSSIYNNPAALEIVAEAVSAAAAQHFHAWQRELPEPLKTKRLNSGEPLSTDRSALNLKESVPLGMSRQRLFLELLYHSVSMNIYRAFICFDSFQQKNNTPLADGNAVLSVNHAITITNIVYQVLKESNFLAGFHETFQWQWNATLTLIGFIVVFPNGPLTIPARDALVTAIEVFDIIGKYIGIACSAASVARDLFARIEPLISPSSSAHGNSHQDSIGIHSFVSTGMQDASNSSFSPHSVGNTQFNGSDQSYGSLGHASNAWSYKNPAEFVSLWTSYPIEEEYVDNGFEFGI